MAIVEYDYSIENPINIIGDFDTGRSVNIELWVDNVLQTVTSSGCEEVDSTGAYIWSTANIPTLSGSRLQYHFRMTDDLSNSVEGDFVLASIEGKDGFVPGDRTSFIRVI